MTSLTDDDVHSEMLFYTEFIVIRTHESAISYIQRNPGLLMHSDTKVPTSKCQLNIQKSNNLYEFIFYNIKSVNCLTCIMDTNNIYVHNI
jgi:hypothetical protein